MSVILQSTQRAPLRIVMTAFLLNRIVSFLHKTDWRCFTAHRNDCFFSHLVLGTVNLAKTIPAMQAWMMTPAMDWIHITRIANSHCSVVALKL